ncbi:cobalt ABC transporter permease [Clostridium cadaveris]|uniref:cobalt ABC transporter permease n=1 Tax=Clostridium cadaveris TaxID=1529 RepID=UPI0025A465BA|nr:cobalt ABC transporter permease [Clostridium cadaveris]MDM8313629.1 cobalt ABC transporter permease [Clostridium cadaveris]
MQEFLTPILGAIGVALTGVLVAIIKSVGNVAVAYISKKKELAEQKLKLDKHQEEYNTAKQIWNIVEEKYRITDSLKESLTSKADEFDRLLLEKIPYLTKEQVSELRQAIAGEINKGKDVLFKDNFKEEAKKIADENSKLIQENQDLKNKLNRISEVVPSATPSIE